MGFKIYTKKGDSGETGLFGGKRLPKDHIRISAYGMIDELNAHIGHLRDYLKDEGQRQELLDIQKTLFDVGSHLASTPAMMDKLPVVDQSAISFLEQSIDQMEEELPAMTAFILPGGHPTVSLAHIARTVCRRAERETVALHHAEPIDTIHIQYLNRLSDYLFVLGRKIALDLGVEEIKWMGK
ncbi:MAG TPA: cob(I)yrinic acid a,c-diamide adenosyltransferase [Saprospiraceae bacterium]|nr:cob(I)yrinic acid a,c-diamide adenosyltransferase [Saprospiraceae bacterium]